MKIEPKRVKKIDCILNVLGRQPFRQIELFKHKKPTGLIGGFEFIPCPR